MSHSLLHNIKRLVRAHAELAEADAAAVRAQIETDAANTEPLRALSRMIGEVLPQVLRRHGFGPSPADACCPGAGCQCASVDAPSAGGS